MRCVCQIKLGQGVDEFSKFRKFKKLQKPLNNLQKK